MKDASTSPRPGKQRAVDRIGLLLACLALLVFGVFVWSTRPQGVPAADPHGADDGGIVSIAYRLDAQEWSGSARPSLCQIVHHYGLGEAAAAATLYLNRRTGDCALATHRVAPGETIRLALWARPEFDQCRSIAARCPQYADDRSASGNDRTLAPE
ncbi:MAG TPA: hypothetical protein VF759_09685 [Allosphingosinicella sp.]